MTTSLREIRIVRRIQENRTLRILTERIHRLPAARTTTKNILFLNTHPVLTTLKRACRPDPPARRLRGRMRSSQARRWPLTVPGRNLGQAMLPIQRWPNSPRDHESPGAGPGFWAWAAL